MSITLKLKKIKRMPPGELIFRIRELWHTSIERRTFQKEIKHVYSDQFNIINPKEVEKAELYASGKISELLYSMDRFSNARKILTDQKKDQFKQRFPELYRIALKRADAFVNRSFSFLGVSFTYPDKILWQNDPLSLKPYPTGFYKDIDIFTNENAGDVKHVWEVNRLQFLIEIAKACYLTADQKYCEFLEDTLTDWYRANPYKTGIAWASALEVGVRQLALIFILLFYSSCEQTSESVLKILVHLIYLNNCYLQENLSVYFSPYNHLIGETTGLFAGSFLFPDFKNADTCQKRAWQILDDQIYKQFHVDGGSVEQATFYHHFTAGFFLISAWLKRLSGQEVSRSFMQRMEKSCEFAMFMSRPDGTLPCIGDIDDARSIYFNNPTSWDFSAWQALAALWFKRPDMKFMSNGLPEEAFWLMSEAELDAFNAMKQHPPLEKSVHLLDSGYTVFRGGYSADDHFSFMDHGPLAHGVFHDEVTSAAHGHADLLSYEIAPFGESMIIDPGFSNYRGDFHWHSYFRSTAAHNTLTLDHHSQARQGGILQWSHAPKFKLLSSGCCAFAEAVCAEHYGFGRLSGSPVHRRYFLFIDNLFWFVADYLYEQQPSGNEHLISSYLHFNEAVSTEKGEQNLRLRASGKNAGLIIQPLFRDTSDQASLEIMKGGQQPQEGWISPTYLQRIPAPLCRIDIKKPLPFVFATLLLPYRIKNGDNWEVKTMKTGLSISNKGVTYRINWPESGTTLYTIGSTGAKNKEIVLDTKERYIYRRDR